MWTEKIKAVHWDIIIFDLPMPDGDGLTVLREIRQNFPDMRILILSLYPKVPYAANAIKAGASGYLGKDAAPEELIRTVKQVLAGKE